MVKSYDTDDIELQISKGVVVDYTEHQQIEMYPLNAKLSLTVFKSNLGIKTAANVRAYTIVFDDGTTNRRLYRSKWSY